MTEAAQNLFPTKIIPLPAHYTAEQRAALSGRRITYRIRRGVRERLQTPVIIPPSEFSEKYRVMPSAESHEGKWRREFAPHAPHIMDIWAQPWVREIWFCGPDQASKTNTMLSCLGWAARYAPGNIFYNLPAEATGKKFFSDKLVPMFQETPPLKKLLSPRADDTTITGIKTRTGVNIRLAWTGSTNATAVFSAKYTFSDEVDKMEMVGKETDPIRRIKKRAKNFPHTHKHFFGSTPAGKYIYPGMLACARVEVYHGRCPDCGALIEPHEDHIIIPEGATVDDIETNRDQIAYACPDCGSLWDEYARAEAFKHGEFKSTKGADNHHPRTVGFHLSGLITPEISLTEIATEIIKAKAGDLAAKRNLAHGIKCIDYAESNVTVTESALLKYKSELPRNLVPPDTALIALLVDTQQSSFYYQLWSIGYQPETALHMMRHGIVETFSDIEGLLQKIWTDHSGKEFRIATGFIDSGGTKQAWKKHSRTVEVYDWCSKNRVMLPIKGVPGITGDMISYKNIETFPGTSKAIPGGLKRVNIRVDIFKDELAGRLEIAQDDPGSLSFHADIDEPFAKHYTTENKNDAGEWIHDKNKGRNDHFDCTVYALALRAMIKLRIGPKPTEGAEKPTRRIYSKGISRD